MLSSEQLAALFTPEAIAQRKITVEENRLRRARDLAERNALTEGVRNPGYDPDRGNVRFNYTQYGSGANALQYIDDARHTFQTYSELSPNQKGYENFRNYQRALLHNTGISDWSQATNRELFEAIDDTFRGYQEDNQKENFSFGIGDLAKIVAAATVTWATAGAAAPYFGSTLGGTIATGALAGAAGATTSGILNNNLSLRGVVTGAGIGGLLGGAQYAFRPDYFNPSALGLDPNAAASLYSPQALGGATAAGTSGLLRSGLSAWTPSFASQAGTSLLSGGINSIPVNYLGGSATNVFGALPTTGKDVVQGTTMNIAENSFGGNTAGLYPSGVEGSVYDSGGIFRGVGDVASQVLSPQNLLLSSAGSPAPEPAEGGFFNQLRGQLRSGPTITYADYDPVRSGIPGQAGFERTSNIGVPSGYGAVPTGGIADPSLPYGSGLDPYASTARPNFDLSPYFQSPKLFHRGGGVVNVDSGARPTDQESFYQTYESGSQQYSDNLGEGMGITYDRVEGTDIPPQSRLQVFETPPMGVGSLNETARNMSRYAYGGGVGSLNDTARTMTYAGGGIVRAAAMAWQPFKVKIKNQAIFGDFMGYTKTGKVRVLDQESGVEKIYPKSRVRRAYSDEPLPDEPVKKAVGGPIIKTAAELLKRDPAGFFNKSQRVVQEAQLPQATGQRWQQLFQDKGINKAELGGLGLLTFLGLSGDEPITKETVAEFIDQNRLEVGEDYRASVKSDTGERIEFIATEDPMFGELNLSWPEGSSVKDPSKVGYSVVIDPQRNRAVRPANWRLINEDPQRGDDSLSWSIADDDSRNIHSYTGVPMTLDEAKVRLISQLREKSDDPLIGGPLTPTGGQAPRWPGFILRSPAVDMKNELYGPLTTAEFLNYREIALTDQQTGGLHKNTRALINKLSEQASMAAFKPITESQTQPRQHNFPENTLVHTRVTDRPIRINGVDHKNVLYGEEFQSDWAQGAIGGGILRPEDISRKSELIEKLSEIRVKYSALPDAALPEGKSLRRIARLESTEIENEIEAIERKQAYSPFLESGDKKGSVDQSPVLSLAISRLLKEAVDNGQDYVVFSNYADQVTRWKETNLGPLYQETLPNLAKKIVRDLGGYVKPKFKTKEKENKYYKQNPDKVGKKEDAFFADTVIEPSSNYDYKRTDDGVSQGDMFTSQYPHLSATRFVMHITDAMAKKIREEGQPVLSRAAGGPIIKGAAKVLTKPKKAPLLPAETLMATSPVEPLATTRTGYRVVNVDDAGNLVSQADARVVLPPELGSQHNVPMWLTLDDQYAVENYSHGSFEPGERRQVLLTYDFNEKDILQGNLTDVETEFSVGRAKLREMRDLYGEPISPAETLTATRPLSPTGSLFDEKKGRKLLIVGCCETKSKVEELIPASERYKGPLFATLNKAGVPKDVDVAVLSAKHGLIRFDTPLEDYNVKMKDGRKDLLKSPEQLARINNTVDGYGEVFVAGGKDYRNFLDEAGIKGKYTTYTDHADKVRGIGDQRSILAKWLKRKGAAKVLTKKREAPLLPPETLMATRPVEPLVPLAEAPTNRLMLTKQNSGWYEGSIGNHAIDLDRNASPDRKEWVLKVDNEWEETFPTKRSAVEHIKKRYGASYAKGGGVGSLNGIARNMTRYAYGGGVGSLNETARSM